MDGTLVVRNRDFKETQAMSKTVEFLFDVGSPYSYLAYHALPTIARNKGASIVWTPVLLGGIFHATGNHSPVEVPAKGQHLTVDLLRWAKHYGVNYTPNPSFPINTLALMRGAVAMQMRGEEEFQRYLFPAPSAFIRRNDTDLATANLGPRDLIHRHRLDFRTCFRIQKADQFPATPVLASPCANEEKHRQKILPGRGQKIFFTRRVLRVASLLQQSLLR
jgi:hypothetical protein